MFRGTFTALVTPFRSGGIDDSAFNKLLEGQIAAGITGIVAIGTTGESPTLSHDEREHLIRLAVTTANKRCLVLAGTGSNATQHAVADTVMAEKLGVDGALLVAPYYNKPSQEGLFRHFKAIADATSLPVMLYNIPGRCSVDILPETVLRLPKECRNIVSITEASGSVDRVSDLPRRLPESITPASGSLVGAAGQVRMTVLNIAAADPKIHNIAQCKLGNTVESVMKTRDVVAYSSHAAALAEICRPPSQHGKALVIGTTGHSHAQ